MEEEVPATPKEERSKTPRRLGFGFLASLALFAITRGCGSVNASPSWLVGTGWFAFSAALSIAAIWTWEHTANRHVWLRVGLSAAVLAVFTLAAYPSIADQYRREHANALSVPLSTAQTAQPRTNAPTTKTAKPQAPLSAEKPSVEIGSNKKRFKSGVTNPVEKTLHGAESKQGIVLGKDSVAMGRIPDGSKIGDGSVIVGATDAHGNTILNRGGLAVGNGAKADSTSIAIGAHANAGGNVTIQPGAAASFGQQGGITALSVNLVDPPWEISDQQQEAFAKGLSTVAKSRVRIICESQDCMRLQQSILNAFLAVQGWEVRNAQTGMSNIPPIRGIRCNVPEGEDELASQITTAFVGAGIPLKCAVGGAAPFNINDTPALTIRMGTKR